MTTETFECPRCRRRLPFTDEHFSRPTNCCRDCAAGRTPADSAPPPLQTVPMALPSEQGFAGPLTLMGLGFLVAGLWFLFNPGVDSGSASTSLLSGSVVNLQRLTIGETFSIVGSVFLASAWRPR